MKIPQNIKIIIGSIAPLVVVLILFVFAGQFGLSKIAESKTKADSLQSEIDALSAKLTTLESVDSTVSQTNLSLSALPSRNSSIVVVSQLKILAGQQGVSITGIKGGAEIKDATGLSKANVTFVILGPRPQVLAFASSIGQIAPITLINKIKLNENGGGVRADIQVESYWSEFPKTLPKVTDQIGTLTKPEKDLLVELAALKQPLFIDIPASATSGKAEPFN